MPGSSGFPLRGKFYMLAENSRYRINLGRFLTRQATLCCEKAIAEKWGRINCEKQSQKLLARFSTSDGSTREGGAHSGLQRRRTATPLLQERDALHACNFKSFAAAHVLAHHHVIPAQHVRLGLGELGAVAIVRSRRQALLLHAHQPLDLILRRLMTMRTTQICRLLIGPFVEKFALIHELGLGFRPTRRVPHSFAVLLRMSGPPSQPPIIALLRMECAKMRALRLCPASARKRFSPPRRSSAKWPASASAARSPPNWLPPRRPSRRGTSPPSANYSPTNNQ